MLTFIEPKKERYRECYRRFVNENDDDDDADADADWRENVAKQWWIILYTREQDTSKIIHARYYRVHRLPVDSGRMWCWRSSRSRWSIRYIKIHNITFFTTFISGSSCSAGSSKLTRTELAAGGGNILKLIWKLFWLMITELKTRKPQKYRSHCVCRGLARPLLAHANREKFSPAKLFARLSSSMFFVHVRSLNIKYELREPHARAFRCGNCFFSSTICGRVVYSLLLVSLFFWFHFNKRQHFFPLWAGLWAKYIYNFFPQSFSILFHPSSHTPTGISQS